MKELLNKTYDELVEHLLEKYGKVSGDYFLSNDLKEKNPNISRGKEGLLIHHIDEDKGVQLSNPKIIKHFGFPYRWQKSDRLVYCDLLEHLLLHVKIMQHPNKERRPEVEAGINSVINHIVPELNDIYSGIGYSTTLKVAISNRVNDRIEDYISIVQLIKDLGVSYSDFSKRKSLPKNASIWNPDNNNQLLEEIRVKVWGN